MIASEPLHHFVDGYLAHLHETHPTAAALDGVHQYDDLLEDFSRAAIDREVHALGGLARRLSSISIDTLTQTERLDRAVVAANIQSRLFELEKARTWERNPQIYGETLAASLAAQALFDHAPVTERARRVLSKLRQAPRLVQAARDNVKDPPGLYVKVGLETLRGTLRFIEFDLPRAFADVDDMYLLGDLADASTEATEALCSYIDYLEKEMAPKARASFRLGRERFVEKLKLDEGIEIDLDRLLNIGLRELGAVQEEFRRVAGRLGPGAPLDIWRKVKEKHPAPGQVVTAARLQLEELLTFIERRDIVSVPIGEPVDVAPTPEFYRWTFASMWTPGPFESRPSRAIYYLTDVDPAWPKERQEDHLRDLSTAALWSISIHEVYPGHYLHYQHLRHVESKARRSTLLASASCVEGWAHYCEQMMMEAGFERQNASIRLGQLSEMLIRLARFVVAIRLHAEDMSVEQGVRFFREEAFLEEGSARREAERGTFDPTYLVYAAGRMMLTKLRDDYKAQVGSKFTLREFHDTLLRNGTAPFWAHRQLMLGDARGAVLE
jgi:uncharacterized protein (DUF885 family)